MARQTRQVRRQLRRHHVGAQAVADDQNRSFHGGDFPHRLYAVAAPGPSAVPMDSRRAFKGINERLYPFTASLRGLPGLNLGCMEAGIWMVSPVRGFRP